MVFLRRSYQIQFNSSGGTDPDLEIRGRPAFVLLAKGNIHPQEPLILIATESCVFTIMKRIILAQYCTFKLIATNVCLPQQNGSWLEL